MKSTLTRTGPLRVHVDYDGGIHAIADVSAPSYGGAFIVRLAEALKVRVGIGACEGIIPRLRGVPIDGTKSGKTGRVPLLSLDAGPADNLRSWVFLRFQVDLATGLPELENEETATIVHRNDLAAVWANGVSPDDGQGGGHLPLAMIVWRNEKAVSRVVRNVYFNQAHSFVAAKDGRRAFHIFKSTAA